MCRSIWKVWIASSCANVLTYHPNKYGNLFGRLKFWNDFWNIISEHIWQLSVTSAGIWHSAWFADAYTHKTFNMQFEEWSESGIATEQLCVYMNRLMRVWHLPPCVSSFFKRACAAIHWGHTSDFQSDPSSASILYMCKQRRLWRDCVDAQSRLSLRCLPMR